MISLIYIELLLYSLAPHRSTEAVFFKPISIAGLTHAFLTKVDIILGIDLINGVFLILVKFQKFILKLQQNNRFF